MSQAESLQQDKAHEAVQCAWDRDMSAGRRQGGLAEHPHSAHTALMHCCSQAAVRLWGGLRAEQPLSAISLQEQTAQATRVGNGLLELSLSFLTPAQEM